ncbi:MAG: Rieske 2Fe-2S domain-containing protein [Marinobacterium sp.]|nr:Rieske 2Fe-2S domain-containing protein [Marinobacterium sp.]
MTALCAAESIEDNSSKGLQIDGRNLIAVRKRGQLYLYENSCPHRSIPLEWVPDQFLDTDKHYIQCATHGALFRIEDGLCITGPCVDDHLTAVAFEVRDGMICLS